MRSRQAVVRQRQEILDQIAALGPMRRGSVTRQHLPTRRKDGSVGRRGPYWTYTFKHRNKTCGKHLRDDEEAQVYREQIEAFRRYQALSAELVSVSQRLADLDVHQSEGKKNSSAKSRPSRRSRRKPSSRP